MMRRILVDYAKAKYRAKRSGGARKISLDEATYHPQERASELVGLDEALEILADEDSDLLIRNKVRHLLDS